ncbi:uncharacterized protein LOC127259026 isoform X2 [Andrographis paniculata]|uniref:uncharacterized protein LOC127259026 isoform X2 n=1 Tax=Andrographis paniculata TaxID=175694 RepID=UPI0021E8B0D3|nr:uncharacterized protein LOC127259026 isoform X2 [Andrographis paniculata]
MEECFLWQTNIRRLLSSVNSPDVVEIKTIDTLASIEGGVLVTFSGVIKAFDRSRPFRQIFIISPYGMGEDDYLLENDVFLYLDSEMLELSQPAEQHNFVLQPSTSRHHSPIIFGQRVNPQSLAWHHPLPGIIGHGLDTQPSTSQSGSPGIISQGVDAQPSTPHHDSPDVIGQGVQPSTLIHGSSSIINQTVGSQPSTPHHDSPDVIGQGVDFQTFTLIHGSSSIIDQTVGSQPSTFSHGSSGVISQGVDFEPSTLPPDITDQRVDFLPSTFSHGSSSIIDGTIDSQLSTLPHGSPSVMGQGVDFQLSTLPHGSPVIIGQRVYSQPSTSPRCSLDIVLQRVDSQPSTSSCHSPSIIDQRVDSPFSTLRRPFEAPDTDSQEYHPEVPELHPPSDEFQEPIDNKNLHDYLFMDALEKLEKAQLHDYLPKDRLEEPGTPTYASVLRHGAKSTSALQYAAPSRPQSRVVSKQETWPPKEVKAVCLKNLPHTATFAKIYQTFKKFGKIKADGVVYRNQPESGSCYAFVEYEDRQSAWNAIQAYSVKLDGQDVFIHERRERYW